jgi:hypothetical protein
VISPYFLAPNYTTQTAAAYKANIDTSMAALMADSINIGFSLTAGVFTIHSNNATGSALSATNPGFVRIPDLGAFGSSIVISVEANQTFNDDSHASSHMLGNLFGATTGVAWDQDVPFYLYAVSNDAKTAVSFMISRVPHRTTAPVTAEIGASDDPAADDQYSFFSLGGAGFDETLYDGNPCVCLGSFRMQKLTTADDWTVQALAGQDGIGRFQEGEVFTLAGGHFGANASSITKDNGGTAAVFSTDTGRYMVSKGGICTYGIGLSSDGGTDGSGSVTAEIVAPFQAGAKGSDIINGVAGGMGTLHVIASGGSNTVNQCRIRSDNLIRILQEGSAGFWQWADFTNGNRAINGVVTFPIKSE